MPAITSARSRVSVQTMDERLPGLAVLFFEEYPTQANLFFSALLGCKYFKTGRDAFGLPRKWAEIIINRQ
jgi:hypothetical protein